MAELDDNELIKQSRRNPDRRCRDESFNKLVLKYQDKLYNMVYRICGNPDDASDICQETFLRAYQNIKGFRGKATFLTWLYQIAINQFYTCYRRIKKDKEKRKEYEASHQAKTDNPISAGIKSIAGNLTDPARKVEAQEEREEVSAALNSLPDEFKQVVVLKDIEDFTYEEISETLRIPVHLVRSRLVNGREQLRCALKKYL